MASILQNLSAGNGSDGVLKSMDANRYATKKTIAQGMLDIALLTANASQLKYILQVGEKHEFYTLMLVLISVSIILQVGMGILSLTFNLLRDCRLHIPELHQSANFINSFVTIMAFIVTGLNLLISAFDPSSIKYMIVGIFFVIIGSLNINRKKDQTAAIILNDIILIMIFVISIDNVLISGFGIEHSSQPLRLLERQKDPVVAGILAVILSLINLKNGEKQRNIANILNHVSLALVLMALSCDVIKMNFGLDPAIPI